MKKILSKGRNSETEKDSNLFLYAPHCLDLVHIAIKFHQDIPYCYLVMACIRIV